MEKTVVVIGAGGHGKVVADILLSQGMEVVAVIDDNPAAVAPFGLTVKPFAALAGLPARGVVAVGDNSLRSKLVQRMLSERPGFLFVSAIHPSAVIGRDVVVGAGTVVMGGAVLNPGTRVGEHVIVNTRCSVDHDVKLADYCSLAPGAVLGGNSSVGAYSAIGLGAMVFHGRHVGEHSVVGGGSVVTSDVPGLVVAWGSPCKTVRPRAQGEKYL